jgi:hypothetical protein
MSSIAPVDLSHQVEGGLLVSTEAPDKEPVEAVAPVPKTGYHRHYLLLRVIVVVMGLWAFGHDQGGGSHGLFSQYR